MRMESPTAVQEASWRKPTGLSNKRVSNESYCVNLRKRCRRTDERDQLVAVLGLEGSSRRELRSGRASRQADDRVLQLDSRIHRYTAVECHSSHLTSCA